MGASEQDYLEITRISLGLFVEEAKRTYRPELTVLPTNTRGAQIIFIGLAMGGESGELAEALAQAGRLEAMDVILEDKIRDELSDHLWYNVIGAHILGIERYTVPFTEIPLGGKLPDFPFLRVMEAAGRFSDHVKKWVAQGHPLDEAVLRNCLDDHLQWISICCRELDMDLEELAACNVRKLRRRYAEGFTPEASMNREA